MTDKEIIKALDCCGNVITSSCKECSYHSTYNANCVRELMRNALDLINRQQAEIERLSNSAKQWEDTAKDLLIGKEKQQEEIERLKVRLRKERHQFADLGKMYSEIRAEAIKEFAERLKNLIRFSNQPDRYYIDCLVKEMVGEDK